MKTENNICKFLEWDSSFFGVRVARLSSRVLTDEIIKDAFAWCRENEIDCLYFLADSEDLRTVKLAEYHDFNLTDVRITFETRLKELSKAGNSDSIRPATSEDVAQLRQIARTNHRDSRFYYDGRFAPEKCDELFAVWIEKSLEGFADVVLTAKPGDVVQGYITCSVEPDGTGNIGLVGVNPNFQGQGTGRLLVGAALEWFGKRGVAEVTVVTQGRNIKAQRLYQRNGFVTAALELWYHRWFSQGVRSPSVNEGS